MRNEFTAIIEQDGDWFIAHCPEIPGANGQGETKDLAPDNLVEAIVLVLEDRREDGLRGIPPDTM
jgi:predicted RNase H-like HicB family nuclease